MPTDDRGRQFERALARHLRDAADSTCPDSEILAAYYQRTLSPEEMAKRAKHIASCQRCQQTLSFVEQTENDEAEEWKEQDLAVMLQQTGARPALQRAAAAEIPAGQSNRAAAASRAAPVAMAKRHRRASWRWMLPMGALAAGAIVWIGVNEVRTQQRKAAASVELAENRQAATAAPLPPAPSPQAEVMPSKPGETAALKTGRDQRALGAASVADRESRSSAPQVDSIDRSIVPGALPPAKEAWNKQKEVPSSGMRYGSGAPSPPSPVVTGARNAAAPAPSQNPGISAAARAAPAERAKTPMATPEAARVEAADKLARSSHAGNLSAITGTVLDPSGAGISGAVITAIDTSSGNSRTAVADATGNFRLTDLTSDQYRLIAAHAGFASAEQVLTLEPQRNEQVQMQLKLGAVAESAEVSGAAATLNTASAELTSAKGAKPSESELSTPGRNRHQLIPMAAANPRYIVAPGEEMVWRVGEAGKIERSTDAGKTWKSQRSGVSADLQAGSATSDRVCWLIGKAGTILLTTDGGTHWKQVTSPLAEDLGGIHARDAQHASIWDVANRNSFETDDGGTNWKRTANE
jgi:Carboxypeptidase regulatory-like domain/Photosynthesis system II assembly factor YCF48